MAQLLASLVAQLTPGEKTFRLLPAGEFRSSDGSGRPADAPAWRLDAASAAPIIARHAARQTRPVIDYEHQTLLAAQNGQPAPASGWMETMEWREDGLYITPEWTGRAAAMIDAREYRYISPVFSYDKTGRVLDIKHAAITNNPGLDGLTDLAALSALFNTTQEESTMDLDALMERLRYLLNLPLTITPAEMGAELDKIKAMLAGSGAASLTAYLDAQTTQIAALKAAAPNPAQFVSVDIMRDLQTQVAALTAQINEGEVGSLIEAALSAGQLLPPQEAWARDLGKTNLAALKSYLATAPQISALTGNQTNGKTDLDTGKGVLSAEQVAVCTQMGIAQDDYLANLKQ